MEVSHGRRATPAAVLLAGLLALTACVAGDTTHGHGRVIPPSRFDATLFFCPRPLLPGEPCEQQATPDDIAQVRSRLLADPDVKPAGAVYVSPAQAIQIALKAGILPPAAAHLGELPASFVVALNGISVEAFAARYRDMSGVDDVVACTDRPYCRPDMLRSVGALH